MTGQHRLPIIPYFKTIATTSIKNVYQFTALRIAYSKEELMINIGLSLIA